MNDHLSALDSARWPGVANPPPRRWRGLKSRLAEAEFARACQQTDIALDGDADLRVEYDTLFDRIAESGWTGLAEGFMAGEWSAPDEATLVDVLRKLLRAGYHPKTPTVDAREVSGQLPPSLVRLFAGDGMSAFQGRYASGVATTVRESVPSFVPGAGRGNEPSSHFVDVTTVAEPVGVSREDLADSQQRAAEHLLQAAQVRHAAHMLVYPASGGQVEGTAATLGATVDAATGDPAVRDAMQERLILAGASSDVHLKLLDDLTGVAGEYDGIVSAEHLETFSGPQRVAYVQTVDQALAMSGSFAFQTTVAGEAWAPVAESALQSVRAYVWPGLEYPTLRSLHRLCDRHTNLRITAHTDLTLHHVRSLATQRSLFHGHLREAAAAGYDQVYRRLIDYQFALRIALMEEGMINGVVVSGVHRHRRGRR